MITCIHTKIADIHSNIIHMERTQMSINCWMHKQVRHISTLEYYFAIKKNNVLIYATMWMNLKHIMLSVRDQS